MNDMSAVIIPKSDQLNADDLIAGPLTVTISEVRITPGSEQPVSMMLEGTDKAYRPCKSMSRVFVQAWGADAKAYVGRSVTLYRDADVKWGGLAVGGIRISHMSDIGEAKTLMLTATKGSRKPHKVLPLVMPERSSETPADKWASAYLAKLDTFTTTDAVEKFAAEKSGKLAELKTARADLHAKVTAALDLRRSQLAGDGFDDDFAPHPAQAAADKLRAEFRAAADGVALAELWTKNSEAITAMPDEIGAALEADFNACRALFVEPAQ